MYVHIEGRLKKNTWIIQLTEDGVVTEPGQNVQLNVDQEHKPKPGLVQTQLQLMVVQIVLGTRLKHKTVTYKIVQVITNTGK